MIVVTGGAGFIGSAFVAALNVKGIDDILVVDNLGESEKWKNLRGKTFTDYLHKDVFQEKVLTDTVDGNITAIVHLGACSSTTEKNVEYLMANNLAYSKELAEYSSQRGIRFIYASSAATYGGGEQGYSDTSGLKSLMPLNGYGFSKHLFDLYMEKRRFSPNAAGLKFFNVFGPNEYHKGDMSSVVFKSWKQIKETGKVKLFRSHRPDYKDGEQKRDFVYVKDCCDVMLWLLDNPSVTGVFNLGSGMARTWNDLVKAVFASLGRAPKVEYVDMPEHLQGQYQYFTQADMAKLAAAGCPVRQSSLEDAVRDYVTNYLEKDVPYL